ncbi:MAG: lipoate--protein ligase family protein [Candidatus Omnitrophota bacterium]|nr:lipoate--protein ligase family protein [Candidatus Omnitrophota bacterium]
MKSFRLIRSGASCAAGNMALDAEIFKGYLEDGVGVLRLYRWQAPAFTYGFSQEPKNQLDLTACAADGVGVVKRITGGGTLFHDDEITYSFVCSKTDVGEPEGVFVDYRNLCAFLMRFYESLGLAPAFALEAAGFKDRCASHALCSAAYEKYDIVINGRKIGGNAQKRNRQVIFQHGSIPCRINWDFARKYIYSLPKDISTYVTTLSDELKVVSEKDILEQKLIDAFAHTFKVNLDM